ncbi:hypothetical protein AJ80_05118 [Polytolypa hystricis UAMH7299]|uniref:Zn(2)-C6 fungal-type domain-containing protein n=1 Tax=Polytolypa hystricis (strain UAMH7299) TaxID=1447883 RepID=A0A2B7Y559_POLH7|nr:hypothetical protein AJ80_05118 [Polytolypa hystricis UAMH7299]
MGSYFVPEGIVSSYPHDPSSSVQYSESLPLSVHTNPVPEHYSNPSTMWHHPPPPTQSTFQSSPSQSQMPPNPPDQKKHKRTRSGCYTCRSRRVKCDETHPICERCSKGKRDCVYPPPPMQRTGSRTAMKSSEKYPPIPESDSSDENQERDSRANLPGQNDTSGDAPPKRRSASMSRPRSAVARRQSAHSLGKRRGRFASDSASRSQDISVSPVSDATGVTSDSPISTEPSLQILSNLPGASGLRQDIQFFLAYRQEHINHRHYFLRSHAETFVHDELISYALAYEPLLYAVVAFSAYHYSLSQPNAKLVTFLRYYDESVSALLRSLRSGKQSNDATLLTVLQLTAFEECVGDWVNLLDHHKAAHGMILELYTPESINQDPFHEHLFTWFTRFDVMVGLLAGQKTVLDREWYAVGQRVAIQDAANNPNDINKQVWAWSQQNRTFAMDMAELFAKATNNLIPLGQFASENQLLFDDLENLQKSMDAMRDPRYLVTSYPNKQPLGPDDIVDPYFLEGFYDDPISEVNLCAADLIGGRLMLLHQTGKMMQQSYDQELQRLATEQCRIVETIARWPNSPKEYPLLLQNAIGIAALHVPRDDRYIMWCRQKLAFVEQQGYIYPPKFREAMAEVWGIPDVAHRWLPNNGGGNTQLVQEIYRWTQERTTNPRDPLHKDVRDMKLLFNKMNLDYSSSSSPISHSGPSHERSPDQFSP